MIPPTGGWLTGPRLGRLATALRTVGANAPGIAARSAVDAIWRRGGGGSHEEAGQILQMLIWLNLLQIDNDMVMRTSAGNPIARSLRAGDFAPLGLKLIRAGVFSEQARALIESGKVDVDGKLVCLPRTAEAVAPQLIGLLSRLPEYQSRPRVVIPSALVDELSAVWALGAPEDHEPPRWLSDRQRVGERAEWYSLQHERSGAEDPAAIAWVSRDSDRFGWDIEDRAATPYRRIEVKGSRREDPVFFMSENEWNQARIYGASYEVQYWGNIDLRREKASEYPVLRSAGFPVIISNLFDRIASGEWDATPVQWRISKDAVPEDA